MIERSELLRQKGYFWWNKTKLPSGCFAPSDCATGTVIIRSDGKATLELDGMMSGEDTAFAAMANPPGRPREAIQGKLKDGSSILLFSVVGDGGSFSSRGISFQRFSASGSLVSQYPFKRKTEDCLVKEIVFNLQLLADWMLVGGIELKRSLKRWSDSAVAVKYKPTFNLKYESEDKSCHVFNFVESTFPAKNLHEAKLKTITYLRYKCHGLSLAEVEELRRSVEDFVCLLTGKPLNLEATRVVIGRRETDFYFWHNKSDTTEIKTSDCCVPFRSISSDFGLLLCNWIDRRKHFGPGFYMLLAHKRLSSTYLESKFAGLASGIEALSRTLGCPSSSSDVQTKVAEIIESALPEHKAWLSKRLRNASEPNLHQRLFAVISRSPLPLNAKEMHRFCEKCMHLRNDISHFGGPRKHPSYSDFLQDLQKHIYALEILYHASVLREIGVNSDVVSHMLFEGHQSYKFRSCLAGVGFTLPPGAAPKI